MNVARTSMYALECRTADAPHAPLLYARGDERLLSRAVARVAVIGSRAASVEGLARARRLSRLVVARDVVVVSGLAAGVDTAAHKATIEAGGKTVAVLGTPLDIAYPKRNAGLQELLATEHLVVSEFPIGSKGSPRRFPMRNRTMAALCDASVVVEASDSSGTLSQASETLRMGKPLWLLRSLVSRKDLEWPARFLANGARVLEDVEPLLEELSHVEDDHRLQFARVPVEGSLW